MVYPNKMQPRLFGDDDFAAFDALSMQGVNVRARCCGHDPQARRHCFEVLGTQVILKKDLQIVSVAERKHGLAGQDCILW